MKMIHLNEKPDIDSILKVASRIKRWAQIDRGQYESLTIPELVFRDPGYFYWALSVSLFKGQLLLEAKVVECRLRHIKVPSSAPANSVFVIQLRDGIFRDFTIRAKSLVKVKSRSELRIASHLDLSIVSLPNFNTDRARGKMLERVKQHFFEKEAHKLGRKDFQEFVGNPDNFASGCRKTHIPDVPRWDDPSVLAETIRGEIAEPVLSPAAAKKKEMAIFFKKMRE